MKNLFIVLFLVCSAALAAQSVYVDLGLPSGTQWKNENEKGGFFTYDKAMQYYASQLPSARQFQELIDLCDWKWTGRGYVITGPNNNYIYLPACGYRENGVVSGVNEGGIYLTSTISDLRYNNEDNVIVLPFGEPKYNEMEAVSRYCNAAFSVRLVNIRY